MQLLLEQNGVGAEVDVFLPRHQAGDDLVDLRMQQRLAAGNADHGRAAFVGGAEAFFGRQVFLQNVRRDAGSCRSRRKPGCSERAARA